jgi:hypothetical protein
MGYSCRADAGMVLDRWYDFCFKSTGMSNVYKNGNESYMIEMSRREHSDGRITGKIWRQFDDNGRTMCVPVSSFLISGNGQSVRAPKCLKAFALRVDEHAPRFGIGSNS